LGDEDKVIYIDDDYSVGSWVDKDTRIDFNWIEAKLLERVLLLDNGVLVDLWWFLGCVRLVRDEAEGRPLLVLFWTRRSMYMFSQLWSLQANTTSYLTHPFSLSLALSWI
jgi:hypothetical protein